MHEHMSSKRLEIYLPEPLFKKTMDGDHLFYCTVKAAFTRIGFQVDVLQSTAANMIASLQSDAYILYHRKSPSTANALEARPSYFGPFWAIDKTAAHRDKRVYLEKFDPTTVPLDRAKGFFSNWSKKLVGTPPNYTETGFVLVAMQGQILRRRSWQSMPPIQMLEQLINAETKRRILIKLHPGETYSNLAIDQIQSMTDDRVELVEGDITAMIGACDYTVSMNSAVSFKGLLHRKPGVLFGDMDCHHIFQNISANRNTIDCVDQVLASSTPFDQYVYWFLYRHMINARRDWAGELILSHCANLGWDLGGYKPSEFRPS